ncbi:dockerin type I repeat-containing protein, partial [Ruminococcus sp.]|uniref:dockerin type I repeat-containing protein n=1 Tax=Ruminococcus sp. TaxID=41978 RepID=UPI00386416C1
NLTPAQADYLTFSAIDKLFKAQDMIRDLEAAKAVEDMINALPTDVTVDDEEQIEAARQAYEALTDDQKALVTPETLEKLTDAETTLDNIVLLGDVDGDGVVTITDATVIQRYLLSMGNLSDKQIKAADVDSDGEITIIDVTLIQRYLAGVKVKFPINEYV